MIVFRQEKLKQLRTALGWSQALFAERTGITRQAVSHYELHHMKPGVDTLARICNATGVKVKSFFTEK